MTDVERKLELTRFLREEDRTNRMKIKTRENILYGTGKSCERGKELPLIYEGHLEDGDFKMSGEKHRFPGFGIRFFLACVLLGAVVYLERSGTLWNNRPAAAVISEAIGSNFSEAIESNFGIDTLLKKYYDGQEN